MPRLPKSYKWWVYVQWFDFIHYVSNWKMLCGKYDPSAHEMTTVPTDGIKGSNCPTCERILWH